MVSIFILMCITCMNPYMPTFERLKAVGSGLGGGLPHFPEIVFSEGRKIVHSVALWIYNLFRYKCSMKKT
jgi:hypothetical protein